jgi:hypothetical protein
MKVNWGALGITIGLIFLAVSMLTIGLISERRISELEKYVLSIKDDIERTVTAQGYAFSRANSEKRAVTIEDIENGYALADSLEE